MKRYVIDRGCKACDACFWACPRQAILVDANGRHSIDPDACIRCGACARACPCEAIREIEEPSA